MHACMHAGRTHGAGGRGGWQKKGLPAVPCRAEPVLAPAHAPLPWAPTAEFCSAVARRPLARPAACRRAWGERWQRMRGASQVQAEKGVPAPVLPRPRMPGRGMCRVSDAARKGVAGGRRLPWVHDQGSGTPAPRAASKDLPAAGIRARTGTIRLRRLRGRIMPYRYLNFSGGARAQLHGGGRRGRKARGR